MHVSPLSGITFLYKLLRYCQGRDVKRSLSSFHLLLASQKRHVSGRNFVTKLNTSPLFVPNSSLKSTNVTFLVAKQFLRISLTFIVLFGNSIQLFLQPYLAKSCDLGFVGKWVAIVHHFCSKNSRIGCLRGVPSSNAKRLAIEPARILRTTNF